MSDLQNELPSTRSESLAWLETGVLTVAFPMLGFVIERGNPFLVGYDFAWVAVPPLLIGLRHGFVRATTSAVVLLAAGWLFTQFFPWATHGYAPKSVMVGTLVLATVAGLFADAHRRRSQERRDAYTAVWGRYQALARNYLVLDVSHERLAQQAGSTRWNLRSLLERTKSWSATEGEPDLEVLGNAMLELVESHGLVEVASVHAVCGDRLEAEPAARLGAPQPISLNDPLITTALRTRAIAVVHQTDVGVRESSLLLAVVPFLDVNGVCRGLLAIHSMPFIAFEDENLRLFAALAGRIGDLLAGIPTPGGARGRDLLELYLKRARIEAREQGTCYAMAVVTFRTQPDAAQLLELLAATEVRDADRCVLLYDEHAEPVLCVLLPMANPKDAKVFEQRVDAWCQATLGQSVQEAGGGVRLVRVGLPRTPAELLQEIMKGGVGDENPTSDLRTDLPYGG